MGVKIAILVGVSEYKNLKKLDACLRDVEVMHELLKQTNEYNDILFIKENVNSNQVKDQIIEFVKKHKDSEEEINQVFFYFTGHGDTRSSEVHFLLSDYEKTKLNSTSLQNSEVDSYLRMLNPKLAIKVIDACYSGATYIKSDDEQLVEKTLRASAKTNELKDCYFMFSSQDNEPSLAQRLSYFTESFVDSVLEQEDGTTIRFKNITDSISDTFSSIYKDEQTPKFVNQANLTEEFCTVTTKLKEQVSKKLEEVGAVTSETAVEEKAEIASIIERVKKEAEDYCTDFSEITNAVDIIGQVLESCTLPDDIAEMYEISVDKGHINAGIPLSTIGRYKSVLELLDEKQNDYFVNVIYTEEEEEFEGTIAAALYPFRKKKKQKPIDLEIQSGDIPFDYISIEFKAKYPSLKSYKCTLLIFLSRMNLLIMHSVAPYKEIAWNQFVPDEEEMRWIYREIKIKQTQTLTENIQKILMNSVHNIIVEISGKFEMPEASLN
ncbi:caspase family protein [Bacillus cereus group sp. BY6-1LC]|uniref:caspase family protein n=1 Tax=Bacillus cereus group sp. BY6-1LC TaxID=3018077 RepID=UPI0022E925F7|nr:caspase family protein [Bacillus cereus group sp. BY6-1LC]MDA1802869.1 caspase family protein [Bacillus cereus group sp. BY6-1LC]